MSRSRRPRSGWPRTLVLLLALVPLAAADLTAQQPTAPALEEGLFEISIARIATRITVTTLVDERGGVLVPLLPVLDLVGIPVRAEGSDLDLEWPPGPWHTRLDRAARTVEVADTVRPAPGADWVERDGQLYLSSALLGRVLAARVTVDWAGLSVQIDPTSEFPATRRLEIEARRERERMAAERLAPVSPDLAFVPRTGGAVAAWGASLAGETGSYRGSARLALGGSIWGGATEGGGTLNFGGLGVDRFDEAYARYQRAFPRGTWVRQLELGSVLSAGTVARRMLGATITNEPFTGPRVFGEALIEPTVPAGWEYEVYQGDALVGVASADATEPVHAPLNYGNTPVRVRMIGPSGEERTEELLYVVPTNRLAKGDWRYHAGLGACQDPGCDSYAFGEARTGISSAVTAGLGVDRITPTDEDARLRPYGFLGLTPLRGVTLDLQGQPDAFFQAALDWVTLEDGNVGLWYAWTRPIGSAPTLDGWYAQLQATLPVAALGRSISSRFQLRGDGPSHSWQAAASTTLRGSYVSATLESGLQQRSLLTAQMFTPVGFGTRRRLQDLAMSMGAGVSSRGPELLQLGASFRPTASGSLSADLHLRRGSSPSLSVGFVVRRPEGYYQSRASTGAATGLFVSADGSVAYDREAGLKSLPFQGLGRAGVTGHVFFDRDGDGVRDPDEEPAVGVDVLVRGERFATDEEGRFRAWELVPYEVVEVGVDSLSVDPSWVPAPRVERMRPSPNQFNRVDLPLRRTREVSGRIELVGAAGRPAGGIAVELRDASGALVASPRTFSDGVFYVQRLPPGRYSFTVARGSLEALGAAPPPPLEFDLGADSDLPLELPAIQVVPAEVR